tara:strand:- start:196 stop:498 length:303 start_codon:yes stop_codon:yes gene_type:complete
MSERTINKDELRAVLDSVSTIHNPLFTAILKTAFPPIFVPKEGEVIVVSSYADFSCSRVRVFNCMDDDGQYECLDYGRIEGDNVASWHYAKPQTPTQKGE